MLNVLIADNDADYITKFRTFIKKNYNALKLLRDVLSLSEMESVLKNSNVDILIINVDFMGPNSIKILKDLSYYHPDTRIILHGTYNHTEYMMKSLEYGVVTYMVKPIKPNDLGRCLNEAIKSIERAAADDRIRKELINAYEEKKSEFEAQFLSTLIDGHLKDEDEILRGFSYFGLSIEPPYTVILLRIDHFKKFVLTVEEREKHLLIFQILQIINKKLLKIRTGKAFMKSFNEVAVILGKYTQLEEIIKIFNDLKTSILKLTGTNVSFGIGKTYNLLNCIYTSHSEAMQALRYRCIVGYNSVIPVEYVEPENRITHRYPIEREQLLVYTAVIGEYDYCLNLLSEILDALKDCGELHNNLLSQIIMDILISINRNAFEQDINICGINKFFPTNEVLKLKDIDEAYNFMAEGLRKFCEYIRIIRKEKEEELYKKTAVYIEANYYENLTVQKVSQGFGCSSEYFKKIIKDYSGKSFIDYLQSVRIRNAKKMILETGLNDEQIAVKTGFSDVSVFRAIFRQNEGYKVSDYRIMKKRPNI